MTLDVATPPPAQQAEAWTIRRLLEATTAFLQKRDVESPRLHAEMLLGHVLDLQRLDLYTKHDTVPTPDERARLRDLTRRAAEHEPVQYLTGKAHFYGLELTVGPGVLIPRPETETIVDLVVADLRRDDRRDEPVRLLDVCTGSGIIALALLKQLPKATAVATDVSDDAAAMATKNAAELELADRLDVRTGDLFATVTDDVVFDVITVNPPYIASGVMPELDRNVRDHEPHLALDGGDDGLEVVRRILADAPQHLAAGGRLYMEIGSDQGRAVLDLAAATPGLVEEAKQDRVLVASKFA